MFHELNDFQAHLAVPCSNCHCVLVDCKTIRDSYVTLIFEAIRFFEKLFLCKLALCTGSDGEIMWT